MHCNNLRLVLRLGLVRVSSRVRVRIRVKVRVSVMVRVGIRTSWVVNFALFRCYRASNLHALVAGTLCDIQSQTTSSIAFKAISYQF